MNPHLIVLICLAAVALFFLVKHNPSLVETLKQVGAMAAQIVRFLK